MSEDQCTELSGSLMAALSWCLLALEFSLKNGNEKSTQALIKCVCTYATSKFVRALLYIRHISGGTFMFIIFLQLLTYYQVQSYMSFVNQVVLKFALHRNSLMMLLYLLLYETVELTFLCEKALISLVP